MPAEDSAHHDHERPLVHSHASTWHDGTVALYAPGQGLVCLASERVGDRYKHSWNSRLAYEFLASRREYAECFGGAGDRFVDSSDGLESNCDHHLMHASSTFFTSGFDEAAVLVVDGQGPRHGHVATTSIWHGEDDGLRLAEEICPSNEPFAGESVGHFYTAIGALAGMTGLYDEGKTMALAAYGEPSIFLTWLREKVRLNDEGLCFIDPSFTTAVLAHTFGPRYFGWRPPSHERSELWREILALRERMTSESSGLRIKTDMDIAFAGQTILEEMMLALASRAHKITGSRQLCMAGGVALNCVANERIAREGPFDSVFVVPVPTDEGQALGKLLLDLSARGDVRRDRLATAYLGPEYTELEIDAALDSEAGGCDFERLAEDDLVRTVAEAIAGGWVVATCYGRSEIGPRALGHRSILADPRRDFMRDHINLSVKSREWFRPLAPVVLEQYAPEYFEIGGPSPFMTRAVRVRNDLAETIPAAVHVDGTARVQTISRQQDARCYGIVDCFRELTGVPVLLNTSFNRRDEPLVETPADALVAFRAMNLDLLVLGDVLVTKR